MTVRDVIWVCLVRGYYNFCLSHRSATGVARPSTNQGQGLAQEVAGPDAGDGCRHHRSRLVRGGVPIAPLGTLAASGNGGVGKSAAPTAAQERKQLVRPDGVRQKSAWVWPNPVFWTFPASWPGA
jgi:hypothetical protein